MSLIAMPTRTGPPPGMAGDRHQPAHALRDLVDAGPALVGTVLAEAGDAAVDDARVDLLHRLVIDAELVLDGRLEVLDDDIGGLRHLEEDLRALPGVFRLSVRLRLLRCRFWKSGPSAPAAGGVDAGPPGASILITSAPQSASWRTAVGPARCAVRSSTLKPLSGRGGSSCASVRDKPGSVKRSGVMRHGSWFSPLRLGRP